MADDNRPLKYMRYAIGEIILVVIGILIALQINTWNEQRKDKERTNRLLESVQKELLINIKETDESIAHYRSKDSLIFEVLNKKVTYDDYKSNYSLRIIIYNRNDVDIIEDAFKNLIGFDSELPKELDSIVLKLKGVYGSEKEGILNYNKRVEDMVTSNLKEIETNKKWFSDMSFFNNITDDMIEYQLNDSIYRNRVANYSMLGIRNHFNDIINYRKKALNLYEEISDYLDLKKDSSIVKNINDYKHYIGRYQADSIYNANVISENNVLKLNLEVKYDTIILVPFTLYPDSKTYFISNNGDDNYFGQLFFDEDNEVSKLSISKGSLRVEFKKID